MFRAPRTDPNALWTEITSRYLHIVPHPELSWWAVRVQLAHLPGYMVNYGFGAILTAEMRQHISEALGAFDTRDPRWYGWLSEHLLRYGSERDTRTLMQNFLGRPVSPQALLQQIHRLKPVSLQATGHHSTHSVGLSTFLWPDYPAGLSQLSSQRLRSPWHGCLLWDLPILQ
jgi:hypothetical protein